MRHISSFPAASTGPLPSKCHEACTANPRPILAATRARVLESTENLGAPLVQYIALIVDVTVYGNTKCEPSRQYRRRKKLLRKTSAGQDVLFHWQWSCGFPRHLFPVVHEVRQLRVTVQTRSLRLGLLPRQASGPQSISTLLSIGDIGTRKDLYLNVMLERSTLSAPNASIALMFVPAVFRNLRQFFSERHDRTLVSKLWCVCSLTVGPLAEDFHKVGCMTLGLFTYKSPTQGHTLANLAGADREHEIVHGAKALEGTVVPAVLLR